MRECMQWCLSMTRCQLHGTVIHHFWKWFLLISSNFHHLINFHYPGNRLLIIFIIFFPFISVVFHFSFTTESIFLKIKNYTVYNIFDWRVCGCLATFKGVLLLSLFCSCWKNIILLCFCSTTHTRTHKLLLVIH